DFHKVVRANCGHHEQVSKECFGFYAFFRQSVPKLHQSSQSISELLHRSGAGIRINGAVHTDGPKVIIGAKQAMNRCCLIDLLLYRYGLIQTKMQTVPYDAPL